MAELDTRGIRLAVLLAFIAGGLLGWGTADLVWLPK